MIELFLAHLFPRFLADDDATAKLLMKFEARAYWRKMINTTEMSLTMKHKI